MEFTPKIFNDWVNDMKSEMYYNIEPVKTKYPYFSFIEKMLYSHREIPENSEVHGELKKNMTHEVLQENELDSNLDFFETKKNDTFEENNQVNESEKILPMKTNSFLGWLSHLKSKVEQNIIDKQIVANKKAEWQKKRLMEVMEEEEEEINDNVFEMVINSVREDDSMVSEALASLYIKQGKTDKGIEMYEKLILKYPEKISYFAALLKEIKS